MEPGDILWVDFGIPTGSTAGFQRPAVVISAAEVLSAEPSTIFVAPLTSNVRRALPTEIPLNPELLDRPSAAQCHLAGAISTQQIVRHANLQVSATELAQIRSILSDLLDIT